MKTLRVYLYNYAYYFYLELFEKTVFLSILYVGESKQVFGSYWELGLATPEQSVGKNKFDEGPGLAIPVNYFL